MYSLVNTPLPLDGDIAMYNLSDDGKSMEQSSTKCNAFSFATEEKEGEEDEGEVDIALTLLRLSCLMLGLPPLPIPYLDVQKMLLLCQHSREQVSMK